ncbi:MAG: hypothetical protein M1831_000543 [Alyxoria varia]|nr:MAG: hypothetical protein M1831_000543 [Alyxoria varia]
MAEREESPIPGDVPIANEPQVTEPILTDADMNKDESDEEPVAEGQKGSRSEQVEKNPAESKEMPGKKGSQGQTGPSMAPEKGEEKSPDEATATYTAQSPMGPKISATSDPKKTKPTTGELVNFVRPQGQKTGGDEGLALFVDRPEDMKNEVEDEDQKAELTVPRGGAWSDFGLREKVLSQIQALYPAGPRKLQSEIYCPIALGISAFVQAQPSLGKLTSVLLPLIDVITAFLEDSPKQASDLPSGQPMVLYIAGTHEMAHEALGVVRKLTAFSTSDGLEISSALVIGKTDLDECVKQFDSKIHIVVGTMGRILHLIRDGSFTIEHLEALILDDVDNYFNPANGDSASVTDLIETAKLPNQRYQVFALSNTMPDGIIGDLHRGFCTTEQPLFLLRMGDEKDIFQAINISEEFRSPDPSGTNGLTHLEQRLEIVYDILTENPTKDFLIFVPTIAEVNIVHGLMGKKIASPDTTDSLKAVSLFCTHGQYPESHRIKELFNFETVQIPGQKIMVSTPLLSWGHNLVTQPSVINYKAPRTFQGSSASETQSTEPYLRQISRTGRLGAKCQTFTILLHGSSADRRFAEKLVNWKSALGLGVQDNLSKFCTASGGTDASATSRNRPNQGRRGNFARKGKMTVSTPVEGASAGQMVLGGAPEWAPEDPRPEVDWGM